MIVIFWVIGIVYVLSIIGCRKAFQEDFINGSNKKHSGIGYILVTFCPVLNTIATAILADYSSWGNGVAEWFFKPRRKSKKD